MQVIEYLPNGLDVVTEQDKKSVFDDIISDAGTEKLSHKQKLKYMEAHH